MSAYQPKIAGATHTPGPWVVNVEGRMVEAQLPNLRDEYEHICDLRGGIKGQINLANAHLIAAAPAMYEALQSILAEVTNDTDGLDTAELYEIIYFIRGKAKSALAQAEGKQ